MNIRKTDSLYDCLYKFKKSWSDIDNLSSLIENWESIVGKELSIECKPLKLEKDILTIAPNHPNWRQALIYNKHKLLESINKKGLKVKNIKIIQHYEEANNKKKTYNLNQIWEEHPSRFKDNEVFLCKLCNRPTPKGEISRWGKCTFCWRKDN